MQSFKCSNCSLLNFVTATACKRCGLAFDPAGGAEIDFDHSAQAANYPQPAEADSHFWDQPSPPPGLARPPVHKSSGMSPLVKVVIVVAIIGMVSAVAIPKLLKIGKTDLTNLTWIEHRSPDEKFSVSLPVAPKASEKAIPSSLGNLQAHILEASLDNDSGCMLLYVDYPIGQTNVSEEAIYDGALKTAAGRQNALAVGSRRYVTVNGYRGVEAELNPTNPNTPASGGVRIFWVSPRLYVLVAAGPTSPEMKAVQTRCLESFRLLKR